MGKTKQEFLDKLEKLQTDYAECKIDTEQFDQGLKDLGIHSEEERMFEKLDAEEARYNFKMDNAAEQTKKNSLPEEVLVKTWEAD